MISVVRSVVRSVGRSGHEFTGLVMADVGEVVLVSHSTNSILLRALAACLSHTIFFASDGATS